MFQKTVARQYTTGFPGDVVRDGPMRAKPARIASADQTLNVISRAFGYKEDLGVVGGATAPYQTIAADGYIVEVGGTNFFGILGHSKHYARYGAAGEPLAATMTLPNGLNAEFFDMCTGLVVELFNFTASEQAVGFGFDLCYVGKDATELQNANGVPAGGIFAVAKGAAAPEGTVKIPNAMVVTTLTLDASAPDAPVSTYAIVQLTQ